jgi:6-methylsalicylate decarboxylase
VGTVDFHQHLWPEPFVRALRRRSAPPRLDGSRLELAREGGFETDLAVHTLERRLALLDEAGIDVAVVSLAPTMEVEGEDDLVEAYHEGILELAAASGGRLQPLAGGVCREGFVGACVSPAALVAGIDELASSLEAVGQFLFVHPGPPERIPDGAPAWWAAVVDYTAQMQAAYAAWLANGAAAHPGLRVVFSFLAGGGPFQLERLGSRGFDERSALLENVYFETCSYGRRALELCLATYGVRQLVLGTDTPVLEPGKALRTLDQFGEAVANAVCKENPKRLLS